jgi:hypothetical protein
MVVLDYLIYGFCHRNKEKAPKLHTKSKLSKNFVNHHRTYKNYCINLLLRSETYPSRDTIPS